MCKGWLRHSHFWYSSSQTCTVVVTRTQTWKLASHTAHVYISAYIYCMYSECSSSVAPRSRQHFTAGYASRLPKPRQTPQARNCGVTSEPRLPMAIAARPRAHGCRRQSCRPSSPPPLPPELKRTPPRRGHCVQPWGRWAASHRSVRDDVTTAARERGARQAQQRPR